MSSSFRAPPVPPSDEVDFVALFDAVWQQKKLVALFTFGALVIAGAYAFLAKPEYQVSSVLRPAAINELDSLNRSEIYKLPPREALIKVGSSLESYDTRLAFFRANQKLFKEFERPGRTLEQSFEEFNRNSISLSLPDPKKSDALSSYIRIEMNYPAGVDGVSILNGFVEYAISNEKEQVAADLEVIVKNRLNELAEKLNAARAGYDNDKSARIASLQEASNLRKAQLRDELNALRAQLKMERVSRVAQLSEAIGIAKSLGIKKPTTPSSLGEADRGGAANMMRTEVNNQQIPLYFMGTDALEAERGALQQRKSDDFTARRIGEIAKELQLLEKNREVEVLNSRQNEDIFLAGVQPLRAEAVRLRNLNIDISRLKLVTIDKQALEPLSPVKPNRKLVLIIGLVLGLGLGVGIAMVRYVIGRRQTAVTQLSRVDH
ncbi:chain-length determining protein [Pseudomonas veronii]|uniref:Chain-length determining protein n=1 Tax=Pseudomonas veronii TaxID=76761 RepID=A0A0R3BE67_PSEVE|nr:Wzz/FepE/Etk N-terminal domain-containing protein [Pseudomonas veronii]SEC10519.1 LPS O-antigen chain length determinant protein, WzzB/FepE family [Pseudomonas marginalis]KRP83625.1 chain-length determining protein [Pseudomonas veronii]NMX96605.1 chain-length determining protein [Pseudomonas veronii]RTY79109.1 chain-length determining protein [Pseudomonas veronii]RWA26314.1 chain-length determining protein [Pseudomonas veronii]